jgi:hypothetical protein
LVEPARARHPGLPGRMSSTPSSENLISRRPMQSRPPASVTHRLPFRRSEPCGKVNMPLSNPLRSLPLASNLRIGGSGRPAQTSQHSDGTRMGSSTAAATELRPPIPCRREARPSRVWRGRVGADRCAAGSVSGASAEVAQADVRRLGSRHGGIARVFTVGSKYTMLCIPRRPVYDTRRRRFFADFTAAGRESSSRSHDQHAARRR